MNFLLSIHAFRGRPFSAKFLDWERPVTIEIDTVLEEGDSIILESVLVTRSPVLILPGQIEDFRLLESLSLPNNGTSLRLPAGKQIIVRIVGSTTQVNPAAPTFVQVAA